MIYINRNIPFMVRCMAMFFAFVLFAPHTVVFAVPISADTVAKTSNVTAEAAVILKNDPIIFNDFTYEQSFNPNITAENLRKVIMYISDVNDAKNSGEYSACACEIMQAEYERLINIKEKLTADMDKFHVWESEYYYAAQVFKFLMERGYSREVACAIIGNMMVETGGNTLKLVPSLYDAETGDYYGLCQWSLYWRPEADNLSFEEQLEYLMSDIEHEINTFGFCYKADFGYDDFITMTDPQEAAVAFAMSYERCATWSYNKRYVAAGVAYNYFS